MATDAEKDDFQRLADIVIGGRAPRVWSLLVTVFGDLAQAPGAEISGALLGALSARMGLRPEATRVALHRLRKDGWIESRRQGRGSRYALSPAGRRESAAASPRIYARPEAGEGGAWLVIGDPSRALPPPPESGVALAPALQLWSVAPREPSLFAVALPRDTALPAWIATAVGEAAPMAEAREFEARLKRLDANLGTQSPDPLDAAALRILLVHEWRRILLRSPAVPDHLFPRGWAGPFCRAHIAALLGRLPRPDLAALEAIWGNGA